MLECRGTKIAVIQTLQEQFNLSTKEANQLFTYLAENPDLLDDDECIKEIPKSSNDEGLGLLLGQTGYYVNLHRATVLLAATILDYKFFGNIAAGVLMALGTDLRCVAKLKAHELCVVKEVCMRRKQGGNTDVLDMYGGECFNCDMPCEYRKGDNCVLKDIEEILASLEKRSVLKKDSNGYRYQH